ncbi:MAG: GNAT family N-acetyltransferase [Prolixibacteraceae bacterium]|nr:GNAT family N-acetyltransferase [Prolixibacteraceae bacterium]MBN2775926.1 GNAT family N-acetyltransferase [Prolixibacteraceae bacterium]
MQTDLLLFDNKNIDRIYFLLEEIYNSSDTMSELFSDKFPDMDSCESYFQGILNLHGGIVLFAVTGQKYIGYLAITPRHQRKIKHTSELNMGVHPGFQGKGTGHFLLNEAFKMLRIDKIIEIVYLMVRSDNTAAIRLYEKFGFEKMALLERDTKIENKYFDGILMRMFV